MSKRKANGRTTPLEWVIRVLILLIFVVSIALSIGKLMEWNENRRRAEELREQNEQYGETGDDARAAD